MVASIGRHPYICSFGIFFEKLTDTLSNANQMKIEEPEKIR